MAEMDHLLKHQLVGRIGCSADDIPYVIPVSYVLDGDYVYVHTYPGMKLDIMRKNPKVCFQVDDTRTLANWQSVICRGVFEELKEEADQRYALKKLQERILPVLSSETMHISRDWPFPADENEKIKGIYFRIRLLEKTGRYEKIAGQDFYAT